MNSAASEGVRCSLRVLLVCEELLVVAEVLTKVGGASHTGYALCWLLCYVTSYAHRAIHWCVVIRSDDPLGYRRLQCVLLG